MSDPYVGEIRAFPYNFAPYGWALCNGQILQIAQNTTLFSLIGITFGTTNQSTNFRVPNLQGRLAIGAGNGPGLTPRNQASTTGQVTVTLTNATMAAHQHGFPLIAGPTDAVDVPVPGGYFSGPSDQAYNAGPPTTNLSGSAVGIAGGSGNPTTTQPHPNVQPTLAITYCIATDGIYPDFE
jgi:microcystin-dependent protein